MFKHLQKRFFFIVQEVSFDGHSTGSPVQTSKLKHQLIYIFLSIIGSIRVRGSVCYVIYKNAKWVDLIPFMTSYSVTISLKSRQNLQKLPQEKKAL